MPSANPLTITTSFLTRVFAISPATSRPFPDAFRDPMMANLGLGTGISMGPEANSFNGACFLSTSFSGPRRSSGLSTEILGFAEIPIILSTQGTMNDALFRQRIYSPVGPSSRGSLFNVPSSNFPNRDLPYLRGQEAGIQKLVGSDNSFLNEAIPEVAGSSLGPEAFHQLVRSTPKRDQTRLSQLFYRI